MEAMKSSCFWRQLDGFLKASGWKEATWRCSIHRAFFSYYIITASYIILERLRCVYDAAVNNKDLTRCTFQHRQCPKVDSLSFRHSSQHPIWSWWFLTELVHRVSSYLSLHQQHSHAYFLFLPKWSLMAVYVCLANTFDSNFLLFFLTTRYLQHIPHPPRP